MTRLQATAAMRSVMQSLLTSIALLTVPVAAWAVDDAALARRSADGRQARAMARELVSSVLDLQLRQLQENNLTDLPLYRDIRTMKANLAGLVETEMAGVVDLLVAAQNQQGTEREQAFVAARRAIRQVVVRLSLERQTLLRRLKAAEIAAQARRLIELQTTARDTAAALPATPPDRRDSAALRALEDQRDVKELYVRLVETLGDVKTWDGPVAEAAAQGLALLDAAQVGNRLAAAEADLTAARPADAADDQAAVLDALRKLLSILDAAQGAVDHDAADLAAAIKELREKQEALRDQVAEQGLQTPPEPELVAAQQQVSEQLTELANRIADTPTTTPLVEQAQAAAAAATENLFSADEAATLDAQERVVDRLAALETAVAQAAASDNRDRSAAELAEQIKGLEAAKEQLQAAVPPQREATANAATDTTAAAKAEQTVAENTEAAAKLPHLPQTVAAKIDEAKDAAKSAADTLNAANANPAGQPEAAAAVKGSADALQQAQAAVNEALADTKRAEAGVRIGELARAAEALERAAAAERDVAAEAAQAAAADGLSSKAAEQLRPVQEDVAAVAAKTAEAVQAAAPQVAAQLAAAAAKANQVGAMLDKAAALAPTASQPDAASQANASDGAAAADPANAAAQADAAAQANAAAPAASQPDTAPAPNAPAETAKHEIAKAAAEQAGQTAEALSQAAASLREEVTKAAEALQTEGGAQLGQIGTAQEAVNTAMDAAAGEPAAASSDGAADASAQVDRGATAASQAAAEAARGTPTASGEPSMPGSDTDRADALHRAAVSLAAREQQVRRDVATAARIAALTKQQQAAAQAIAKAREDFAESVNSSEAANEAAAGTSPAAGESASSPGTPAPLSPAARAAADALRAATAAFAQSLRGTGQGAAAVSGQRQVANMPLREALNRADELPIPDLPIPPSANMAGAASEPEHAGAADAADQDAAMAQGASPSGDASPSMSQGEAGAESTTASGTGLVPDAPEATARAMAGAQAQAAMAMLEAEAAGQISDTASNAQAQAAMDGTAQQPAAQSGSGEDNAAPKEGPPSQAAVNPTDADGRTAQSGHDSDAAGRGAAAQPWFANLPPEVQAALRARSNRAAPRTYEGRLRRYFESVDE